MHRSIPVAALFFAASCSSHTIPPAISATESVTPTASRATSDATPATPLALFVRHFQLQSTPMQFEGNYLGIVQLLERERATARTDTATKEMIRQLLGTYATFVGQSQEALEAFAIERPQPVAFDSVRLGRLAPEDAVDGVARLAANRRAVFINEAHHMPRDRAFAANLLPKLKASGFSYLAVETLSDGDTALNHRGYPVRGTGFYSQEPVFGELLRVALKLGFTLVPYESPAGAQDAREQGEAQHIVDRILKKDPKAKIVVYGDYDHINESGTVGGAKPMAVRFRDLTGIDPLTIDQTTLTEQADTTYEDSRYRYLMKRVRRQAPFVLKTGDSLWSARPGVHDITVIHPRAVNRAFRPNWLYAFENRRAYLLSDEICGTSALDCVVTARNAEESADAVPVDVLRIQFSAPGSKTFVLPAGRYLIEARDGSGALLSTQTVTIAAR